MTTKEYETEKTIYHQFIQCLLKNYREERIISFYADKLCISAKYLVFAIKEVRGKSALDLINEAVILDAASTEEFGFNDITNLRYT